MQFDYFVVYTEGPGDGYTATIYSEIVAGDMYGLTLRGSKDDALIRESAKLHNEIVKVDAQIAEAEAAVKELTEVAIDLRLRRKAVSAHRLSMSLKD